MDKAPQFSRIILCISSIFKLIRFIINSLKIIAKSARLIMMGGVAINVDEFKVGMGNYMKAKMENGESGRAPGVCCKMLYLPQEVVLFGEGLRENQQGNLTTCQSL